MNDQKELGDYYHANNLDEAVLQKLEFGQQHSLLAQEREIQRLHEEIKKKRTFYNDFDSRMATLKIKEDRKQSRQLAFDRLMGNQISNNSSRPASAR